MTLEPRIPDSYRSRPMVWNPFFKVVVQNLFYKNTLNNPAGGKLLQYRLVTVLTINHIVTFNNAREAVYSYQIIVTKN